MEYGYQLTKPPQFDGDSNAFVDVDFRLQAQQCNRLMGWDGFDANRPLGVMRGTVEDLFGADIIRQSDWQSVLDETEVKTSPLAVYQYDQNGEGLCTANAGAQALAYAWRRQFPSLAADLVALPSPVAHYRGHGCGGGPNTGSSVSCIMGSMQRKGTLLIDNAGSRKIYDALGLPHKHLLKPTGFSQSFDWRDESWLETASNFRFEEMYDVATGEGFVTALLRGFNVVYGRQGHAIMAADVVNRNGWQVRYHNSWGDWGDQGFGYDSYRLIASSARGAIAVRSVHVPKGIENLLALAT